MKRNNELDHYINYLNLTEIDVMTKCDTIIICPVNDKKIITDVMYMDHVNKTYITVPFEQGYHKMYIMPNMKVRDTTLYPDGCIYMNLDGYHEIDIC